MSPVGKSKKDKGGGGRSSGCFSCASKEKEMPELTPEEVKEFLSHNPEFLSDFVLNHVEDEEIEKWTINQFRKMVHRRSSPSSWKELPDEDEATKKANVLIADLIKSFNENPSGFGPSFLWELSTCITSAISGDYFHLYLYDEKAKVFYQYNNKREIKHINQFRNLIIPGGCDPNTLLGYINLQRIPQKLNLEQLVKKFPKTPMPTLPFAWIIAYPFIHQNSNELVGIVEIFRNVGAEEYTDEDEEIVNSYLTWGSIALNYIDVNVEYTYQKKLHEFLLSVVKSLFQELNSVQDIIRSIMDFGKTLVGAERAALFLIDVQKKELVAEVFDEPRNAPKEIRIAIGQGIAGKVAENGEICNVPDAYNDPNFNPEIDRLTGYKTENILCFPIWIEHNIIGVIECVNKKEGVFSKRDEAAVEGFGIFCGLALWQANCYDKLITSKNFIKIAFEMLSYHMVCDEGDVDKVLEKGVQKPLIGIDSFSFHPSMLTFDEKAVQIMYMFADLFDLQRFDFPTIVRFVLTVSKNYRRVPYHNFSHAFCTANTMYCILKRTDIFTSNEKLALFVAIICHDLDHRGQSNRFITDTSSPLAGLYSTSIMEHHHFDTTVNILQQEGHNLFSKFDMTTYKELLENIKYCILATDLANFVSNRQKMNNLNESLDVEMSQENRLILQSLVMTCCDLSSNAKPWTGVHSEIFEEFYAEGDLEKEEGKQIDSNRDREKLDQRPCLEAEFIGEFCKPAFTLLAKMIPETKELLDNCTYNLEQWTFRCNEIKKKSFSRDQFDEDLLEEEKKEEDAENAERQPKIHQTKKATQHQYR